MNTLNTQIIVIRFNEDSTFLEKSDFKTLIYEKENPLYNYNSEKNNCNDASVYLKYIIENYDNLEEYLIFIHCREKSSHHDGSILDIINSNKNIPHSFTNLNNCILSDIEDLDKSDKEIGIYFRSYIRPAVGSYVLYPNFTSGVLGGDQFIVHKNNILNHSKLFYQKIYDLLTDTPNSNYLNRKFLEWSWNLFWNKCLQNIPIRKYLNEKIIDVQIENSDKALATYKRCEILQFLHEDDYYYVNNDEIILITNYNRYICKNQYIYNKYI